MTASLEADYVVDAAGRGELDIVATALDAGFPVDSTATSGRTALIAAARNGHFPVCRILVAAGADVNRANSNGTSPLMYAKTYCFASGDESIMSLLLDEGADINARDKRGWTILDYVEARHDQLAAYLTNRGAARAGYEMPKSEQG